MGGTNNDVYLIVLLVVWAIATLYAYIFDMDKKSIGPYRRLQRTENNLDPEVQKAIHMPMQSGAKVCRYCGAVLEANSHYCNKCGKSQRSSFRHHFSGEFKNNIDEINRWLADNPYITNVSADFGLSLRPGLFTYRSKLRSIDLVYEVSDKIEPYQYAVVELIKHKFYFTPDSHVLIDKWKENNPSAQIITNRERTYGRGTDGKITNHTMQVYMLVKFPDSQSVTSTCDGFQNVKPKKSKKPIVFILLLLAIVILGKGVYDRYKKPLKEAVQEVVAEIKGSEERTDEAEVIPPNKENLDADEPEDVQQTDSQKIQYAVNTDGSMLNVRKSPQADGELFQKLANGTICEGTGNVTEDGWAEIVLQEDGQTGWASQKYLTAVQESEDADVTNGGTEVNAETENQFSTKIMSDNVTITLIDKSEEDGTISIRITNDSDQEVKTFGYPTLIISGESVGLNPYSNISLDGVSIAAGSYTDIIYFVDSRVFTEDSELSGKLWSASLNEPTSIYQLKIN